MGLRTFRKALSPVEGSWYKARLFLTTPHACRHDRPGARAVLESAGSVSRLQGLRVADWDTRRLNPHRSFTWPACPCDRCWKRVSISDIRPASGTRRWPRSSSASATRSTSSISRRRSRCMRRRPPSSRAWRPRAARCCSSAPSARRAMRSRRRPRAAACPTSTSAGWAACSPISRPSASRSSG